MMEEETTIKLKSGKYLYPVKTWLFGGRRFFTFPFNKALKDEIKQMEGAKWHAEREDKAWSILDTQRNTFQLRFLQNQPVYARYDTKLDLSNLPLERYNIKKNLLIPFFNHQRDGISHILTRHHCGIAGEMGTGKTLMAIQAMESATERDSQEREWWYVAPRSALYSVERDFMIWGAKIRPKQWLTYEGFTKVMKFWEAGQKAPYGIFFDEFSRCRNPTAMRSQAAKAIADGIRDDWGDNGYIVGLTGTPAPKNPADWWFLAEILCPGFLKEGDLNKFKRRLAITVMKEGINGAGAFPQLLGWRDNEKKCNICGEFEGHENHFTELEGVSVGVHHFIPSINEVALLAKRLKGLFTVYFKKDCLDLPQKHYRVIEIKPLASTLRAANLVVRSSRTVIEGLTRLRELSDGFQYVEKQTGMTECNTCKGVGEIEQPNEIPDSCPNCPSPEEFVIRDSAFDIRSICGRHEPKIEIIQQRCPTCGGKGEVPTFERHTKMVPCPKDDAFEALLDEYEDVGRLVGFGGFSGTIDRMVASATRKGWYVIRMDQSRLQILDPKGVVMKHNDFQAMFLDEIELYEKVAFLAHPKSGGMGLTLTTSPVIVYYSNDFDAEARIQSEDRIHRPGMDLNLGATIVDLVHLPSDMKVLENLRRKRELQAMTLGDFYENMNTEDERPE